MEHPPGHFHCLWCARSFPRRCLARAQAALLQRLLSPTGVREPSPGRPLRRPPRHGGSPPRHPRPARYEAGRNYGTRHALRPAGLPDTSRRRPTLCGAWASPERPHGTTAADGRLTTARPANGSPSLHPPPRPVDPATDVAALTLLVEPAPRPRRPRRPLQLLRPGVGRLSGGERQRPWAGETAWSAPTPARWGRSPTPASATPTSARSWPGTAPRSPSSASASPSLQLLPPFDLPGGRRIIGLPLIGLGTVVRSCPCGSGPPTSGPCACSQPLPGSRLSVHRRAGHRRSSGALALIVALVEDAG